MPDTAPQDNERLEADRSQKIQSLREMISSAERTIQSTKAMLLQLEGKKKSGRPRKFDDDVDGKVVEGSFDGQHMIGTDGRQYPVPPNYASKSKLVEGDMLKLTITPDGSFVYKQIGPVERRHVIGVVTQDDHGNHYIVADGKPYRVLLASITYFKALPGDEAAIVTPRDLDSDWAAVENIIRKAENFSEGGPMHSSPAFPSRVVTEEPQIPAKKTAAPAAEPEVIQEGADANVLDEWIREMEAIEKELSEKKPEDTPKS